MISDRRIDEGPKLFSSVFWPMCSQFWLVVKVLSVCVFKKQNLWVVHTFTVKNTPSETEFKNTTSI